MTAEHWRKIQEIFSEAWDLTPSEREARVRELCAGDEALREEVMALLDAPESGQGILDKPPLAGALGAWSGILPVLNEGDVLAGRFVITGRLGAGGMGEVYEAEDRELGTRVAVKVIRRESSADAHAQARFRREVALARQVTHRSVCRVFDYFPNVPAASGASVDFLTMEMLRGETLSARLAREGPMPFETARPLLEQICDGLAAAHAAGVLHRDLKGANIFLTEDAAGLRIAISDFGLARSQAGGDTVATGSNWAAGTPAYMSPEQLEGGEIGPASDIYALGVVMYEMATGTVPHGGASPLQVAVRRVKQPPRPPHEIVEQLDAGWETAILRCLAYRPEDRFPDVAAVARALGNPVSRFRPQAAPLRPPPRWALAAAALVALAAGGWWAWRRLSVPPLRPEVARWYREGVTALGDGSLTRAARALEQAREADPAYLSAGCRLAEAYLELDMRDRAQEELLKALAGRPRDAAERLLCESVQALLNGNFDAALAAASQREQTVASQNRVEALLDAGRWNERAGRPEAAAGAYEAVLTADASQPGALLRLAAIRAQQGNHDAAAKLLDRAEQSYTALANAEGLGEAALARVRLGGNVEEEIRLGELAQARASLAASPYLMVRAQLATAAAISRRGDTPQSAALTREAAALAEREGLTAQAVNAFIDLGYLPFAQGKMNEAEKEFDRALQLAQRYRHRRAEARARLTLAQLYRRTGRARAAMPLVEYALAFFQKTGDLRMVSQSLRFQGDLQENLGQPDAARAAYQKALAASPAPADQLQSRQRLAFLARQLGRYEEAAVQFTDIIAAAEESGERVTAQTYRLELAAVLTATGRFPDAARQIAVVRAQSPANGQMAYKLDVEQTSLDFQQLRFEAAIARLSSLLAAAKKEGEPSREQSMRYQLCAYTAEAAQSRQALALCTPLKKEFRDRPLQLITVTASLALAHLDRGATALAVREAEDAVRLSEQAANPREIWYSLLVLCQAQHKARLGAWMQTRARAHAAMETLGASIGRDALRQYVSRPIIARRRQTVDLLQ